MAQKGKYSINMGSTPAVWKPVQQNGRFTLFSSKFLSIYSILYGISKSEFVAKTQFL